MKNMKWIGIGVLMSLGCLLWPSGLMAESGTVVPHTSNPVMGPTVPVFDALLYRGKPTTRELGMQPISVIYSAALWKHKQSRDEPNPERIRREAEKLADGSLVCIDIEYWRTERKTPEKVVAESIRKLAFVADMFKAINPTLRVGFYGILPTADKWRAIHGPDDPRYQRWVRENQRLEELASHVDVIFPSLYTFDPHPEQWQKYAIENMKEARRYGKPVYGFLWPKYHESNKKLDGQYIPASYWRMQLQTCQQHADGIVIWGGWRQPWDQNSDWWRETAAFLRGARGAGTSMD